jgi:hypothetical protein
MTGRPSMFSQELADRICLRLSEGDSLRKICEGENMPSKTTVMRWLIKNQEFSDQYRVSRDIQADIFFDEIVDIADSATPETAIAAKLRIWARQWVTGRINQRKYGDKHGDVNVTTAVNNCVLTQEKLRELQQRNLKALGR